METGSQSGQSIIEATILLLLFILTVFFQMRHMNAVYERDVQQHGLTRVIK